MRKLKKIRSSFAHGNDGKEITIQAALSGRRGYYCPDCKRMMEAVKPLQQKPRPYFRHVATDVLKETQPCTYSDESYRHRIAKEILVRTKSIQVPKVPMYPPNGFDGPTKQVAPPKTVIAHDVQVERDFYEDENQNLHWGRFDGSEKTSIVRPDVIFFNSNGLPILFIELVATHKPDHEKLGKIKRLGVDTVTVKVPTESSEDIEECFKNTYNTKWFFNNEQERANYFQLPGSLAERISDVDEIQRRLFEETVLCRKNRIRNLVRAFNACLLTEQYRAIEKRIRDEVSTLDKHRIERERIERKIDTETTNELSERRNKIKQRQDDLERVRKFFKRKEAELENDAYNELSERRGTLSRKEDRLNRIRLFVQHRYERKGAELEKKEERLAEFLERQSKNPGRPEHQNITAEEQLRGEIERIEQDIATVREQLQAIQNQLESIPESFERQTNGVIQKHSSEGARIETKYRDIERRETLSIEELKREEIEFERGIAPARGEIIRRFEKLEDETIESIARRDLSADSSLSKEIKGVVSTGERLRDYQSNLQTYQRYEKALRYLNTEAFKTWFKARRSA